MYNAFLWSWDCDKEFNVCEERKSTKTTPWSTYPPGKLYITLHDGDAFGVYSAEIPRGEASQGMAGERWKVTHASSKRWTRKASVASCNANMAELCQRKAVSPN